jgi:mono/diheme cytochrome c family protein
VDDPTSPDPERGAHLFAHYCAICHGPTGRGDGMNAHYLENIQLPDLSAPQYVEERGIQTIMEIIRDGGAGTSTQRSAMPAYKHTFSKSDFQDIIAHIQRLPNCTAARASNLSTSSDPACGTCHNMGGTELLAAANCAACHLIPGLKRRAKRAPSLTGVGGRLKRPWLYDFLQMPYNRRAGGYIPSETVRMPDFDLNDSERLVLTEFLASRSIQEIEWKHQFIPGPPRTPEVIRRAAQPILESKRCLACHKIGSEGGKVGPDLTEAGTRLHPQWIYNWILSPQSHVSESPMPNPGLSAEEAHTLTEYLLTLREPQTEQAMLKSHHPLPPPSKGTALPQTRSSENIEKGKNLYMQLGCWGCHDLKGFDYKQLQKDLGPIGPDLTLAGIRLSRDWVYEFLWKPHPIRPELGSRMPRMRFTRDEIASIVNTLEDIADENTPRSRQILRQALRKHTTGSHTPSTESGSELFVRFDCHSCHQLGSTTFPPVKTPYFPPEENRRRRRWAPDLSHAADRLQRDFTFSWLLDPVTIKGNRESLMPKVGLSESQAFQILEYIVPKKESSR